MGPRRGPRDPYTVGKGAPRIIQRATRAHAQSTPARAKHTDPLTLFSLGNTAEGHRDAAAPKKGRHADPRSRDRAPRHRAPALHQPAHWRMPQPAKAQRARAPAQLKARARAKRERPAEATADQPFGRLLRCRAQPSAGGGVGGTSSTRVWRRRPSHAKLLLACSSKRSPRRLHGHRRVEHDARRTRSPAAPASTRDGVAAGPRHASSGGG